MERWLKQSELTRWVYSSLVQCSSYCLEWEESLLQHHLSVFVVSITVVSRGALCVCFCVVVCVGDEVCHQPWSLSRMTFRAATSLSGKVPVSRYSTVSLKSGQLRCAAGISVSSDNAVNGEVLSVSPMLSGRVLQLGDLYTNLISCTSFEDFRPVSYWSCIRRDHCRSLTNMHCHPVNRLLYLVVWGILCVISHRYVLKVCRLCVWS